MYCISNTQPSQRPQPTPQIQRRAVHSTAPRPRPALAITPFPQKQKRKYRGKTCLHAVAHPPTPHCHCIFRRGTAVIDMTVHHQHIMSFPRILPTATATATATLPLLREPQSTPPSSLAIYLFPSCNSHSLRMLSCFIFSFLGSTPSIRLKRVALPQQCRSGRQFLYACEMATYEKG